MRVDDQHHRELRRRGKQLLHHEPRVHGRVGADVLDRLPLRSVCAGGGGVVSVEQDEVEQTHLAPGARGEKLPAVRRIRSARAAPRRVDADDQQRRVARAACESVVQGDRRVRASGRDAEPGHVAERGPHGNPVRSLRVRRLLARRAGLCGGCPDRVGTGVAPRDERPSAVARRYEQQKERRPAHGSGDGEDLDRPHGGAVVVDDEQPAVGGVVGDIR